MTLAISMDSAVQTLIENMASTTVSFVGDVVTNLWGLLLSLGLLAFAAGFILRKTGMGRR